MKTSNKTLLAIGIVPFVVILIMLFSYKGELDKETSMKIQDSPWEDYTKKNYDFEDFEEIKTEGTWEIVLTGGDHFKIELEAYDDSVKRIYVTKMGKTLILSSEKKYFSLASRPKATITMPSISRLILAGQSDVNISGFNISKLDIGINGAASITGTNSSVDQLSINGNGVVHADFMSMTLTNAHLNYNGAYMIMMKIYGGELSGKLKGLGKLMVSGNISRNTIKTDSPDNIIYK